MKRLSLSVKLVPSSRLGLQCYPRFLAILPGTPKKSALQINEGHHFNKGQRYLVVFILTGITITVAIVYP